MITEVDKSISTPAYQQVRERIIQQIKSGKIKPGGRIPSLTQLCRACDVSSITVRQAVNSLVRDGVLYTALGKGTFVNSIMQEAQLEYIAGFEATAKARGLKAKVTVIEQEIIPADKEMAEHLQLHEGDEVIRIKRVKIANDIPLYTELRMIPHKYCPGMLDEDLADRSLTDLARHRYNITLGKRDLVISPMVLDSSSAVLLRTKAGTPGLYVTETLFMQDEKPFKWEHRVHKSGLHFSSRAVLNE